MSREVKHSDIIADTEVQNKCTSFIFSHLITAPDTLTSQEKKTDLGSQKERGKAYPLAVNRLVRVAVAFQIFVRLPALPKKVFRNLSYFQIRIVDSKTTQTRPFRYLSTHQ
jgi:hypothetical protein